MSTLTVNKTIDFDKLIPDLKRFAMSKKKFLTGSRKVIQYAYYDGQYITVTDSHRLLRVNASYVTNLPSNDPFLYDMKEKEIVTEKLNFPEVNRLIPDYFNTTIEISTYSFQTIRNSLNDLMPQVKGIVTRTIGIEVLGNSLNLSSKEQTFGNDCITTGNDIKLHANCKYMIDALLTVNKLSKLSDDKLTMNFVSPMRPFVIKQGNVFDIIVLPVRTF